MRDGPSKEHSTFPITCTCCGSGAVIDSTNHLLGCGAQFCQAGMHLQCLGLNSTKIRKRDVEAWGDWYCEQHGNRINHMFIPDFMDLMAQEGKVVQPAAEEPAAVEPVAVEAAAVEPEELPVYGPEDLNVTVPTDSAGWLVRWKKADLEARGLVLEQPAPLPMVPITSVPTPEGSPSPTGISPSSSPVELLSPIQSRSSSPDQSAWAMSPERAGNHLTEAEKGRRRYEAYLAAEAHGTPHFLVEAAFVVSEIAEAGEYYDDQGPRKRACNRHFSPVSP